MEQRHHTTKKSVKHTSATIDETLKSLGSIYVRKNSTAVIHQLQSIPQQDTPIHEVQSHWLEEMKFNCKRIGHATDNRIFL